MTLLMVSGEAMAALYMTSVYLRVLDGLVLIGKAKTVEAGGHFFVRKHKTSNRRRVDDDVTSLIHIDMSL